MTKKNLMEPNLKTYDLTSPQTNKLTSRAVSYKEKGQIIIYSHNNYTVRFSGISIVKVYIRS